MDPNTEIETPLHVEPAEEMLTPANEGALAALDAALAGEPATENTGADDAANEQGDADASADVSGGEADGGAADAADADGGKAETEVADGEKQGAETEAVAGKKPSDEFGELPKDVKAETAERFNTMKSRYDELHTKFEQAQAANQQWVETIQSTGATPQQFAETLEFLSDYNAGTPESLERVYGVLLENLQRVAQAIGREAPGADPLDAHPDLKQQVEEHDITRAAALELAQHRAQSKLVKATSEQQRETQTVSAARQQGLAEVRALGERLRTSDPLAVAKFKAIEGIVEDVIAELPPSKWAGAIQKAYNAAQVAAPAPAPAPAPTTPVTSTPLRPTSTPGVGGNLNKQPGSALEAMEAALKGI